MGRGTRDREIRECHGRKGCRGFGRGLGWEKGTRRDWDGRKGHRGTGMAGGDTAVWGRTGQMVFGGGREYRGCLRDPLGGPRADRGVEVIRKMVRGIQESWKKESWSKGGSLEASVAEENWGMHTPPFPGGNFQHHSEFPGQVVGNWEQESRADPGGCCPAA